MFMLFVYWWLWPFRELPVTTGKSTSPSQSVRHAY